MKEHDITFLPSPALSLCQAVGVAASEVLMQRGGGDARLGTAPAAAVTPP